MFPTDLEHDFWDDAPTRRLTRPVNGRQPRTRPAGSRSHTGEIPVVGKVPPRFDRLDPLVRRLGTLVAMIVLAVPVALALRTGSAEGESLRPADAPLATGVGVESTEPATTPATLPVTVAATEPPATTSPPTAAVTPVATPAATTPAPAAAPVTARPAPVCVLTYVVVKGDSWSRIGGKVGVSTGAMMAANNATARTLLLPGKTVCLPAGATPTTVAPPTTAPRPTPTTTKPAPAPTTPPTVPPTRPTYTNAQVIQMIRDVWPDNLEQHAIEIAYRESRYNPYAVNSCCYGVFQINYNAHKPWLPTIGVTSAAQLFDPRVNVQAAYVIYQRSGSFRPWGG